MQGGSHLHKARPRHLWGLWQGQMGAYGSLSFWGDSDLSPPEVGLLRAPDSRVRPGLDGSSFRILSSGLPVL